MVKGNKLRKGGKNNIVYRNRKEVLYSRKIELHVTKSGRLLRNQNQQTYVIQEISVLVLRTGSWQCVISTTSRVSGGIGVNIESGSSVGGKEGNPAPRRWKRNVP